MKSLGHYFTLALYPLGFFAVLGVVQYAILWNAYNQRDERQLKPYVDGRPIPEVTVKIDRRPQSIDIPSLNPATAPNAGKSDRMTTPSP